MLTIQFWYDFPILEPFRVHLDIQVCEAKKVTWELDMKEPKEKLEIQDSREKWVRLDKHRQWQAKARPVLGLLDHPENGGHKDLKEWQVRRVSPAHLAES